MSDWIRRKRKATTNCSEVRYRGERTSRGPSAFAKLSERGLAEYFSQEPESTPAKLYSYHVQDGSILPYLPVPWVLSMWEGVYPM
jgi:hypothetical protein